MIRLYIYAAIALVIVTFTGAVVWKYNHALERAVEAEHEADELRSKNDALEEANEHLQGDLDATNKLLVQRTQDNAAIQARLDQFVGKLGALARENPAAATNLRTPIDPAVRSLRRLNAGCSPDPQVQCTPRSPATDARATPTGRDGGRHDSGERSGTGVSSISERRQGKS